MDNDPAWDMPFIDYQQRGSFVIPEIPPVTEPDEAPLVCLPAINQYWLPYVMGALDQLRNPSSWIVADDDAMSATLYRVAKLKEMIGVGVACMAYKIRFDPDSCELQESTDGGSTWTEVEGWTGFAACLPPQTEFRLTDDCHLQESFDGGATWDTIDSWDTNFGNCVQAAMPIIGLPPNPGDQAPDALACAIADYLANEIILNSMSAAVTNIQDDLTLLAFGLNLLDIIPEFVLVREGAEAFSVIWTIIQDGTISDYEDAIGDGTLWHGVKCAIYAAIVGDGYVTPGNFAGIVTNIDAISYTHSDVITAIHNYVSALGAEGMAQLSQVAGLGASECVTCGSDSYCKRWLFTESDGGWTLDVSPQGTYTAGVGWQSQDILSQQRLGILTTFTATHVDQINVYFLAPDGASGADRSLHWYLAGTELGSIGLPSGGSGSLQVGTALPNDLIDEIFVRVDSSPGGAAVNTIQEVQVFGPNPVPTDFVSLEGCG